MKYTILEGMSALGPGPSLTDIVYWNRDIAEDERFTNVNRLDVQDPFDLPNMQIAVDTFNSHVMSRNPIHIVVDCDVDGYVSAAMLYRYLKDISNDYPVTYSLHESKHHGLSNDIVINYNAISLLVIPDAGSGDAEQCAQAVAQGVDVLVLDHHAEPERNPNAIVVNNQCEQYTNKSLCGSGVVWQFLSALDIGNWTDKADRYLDVVALACVADDMSIGNREMQYILRNGLNRIRNKLFKAFCRNVELGEDISVADIAYKIAPMMNALIRMGEQGEKKLLFRALAETDEWFVYKKRGEQKEEAESIYSRVVRLCANAKARQDRMKAKAIARVEELISAYHIDAHKVLFVNVGDAVKEALTGLVAISIADKRKKPCILLRESDKKDVFVGSGRNIFRDINFRKLVESTGLFVHASGHDNAFGVEIERANVMQAIKKMDEMMAGIEMSDNIPVDLVVGDCALDIALALEADAVSQFCGAGFAKPVFMVDVLPVKRDQFHLIGKTHSTWKITTDNNFSILKFHVRDGDPLMNAMLTEDVAHIRAIGTIGTNRYAGRVTAQMIVQEYEILKDEEFI